MVALFIFLLLLLLQICFAFVTIAFVLPSFPHYCSQKKSRAAIPSSPVPILSIRQSPLPGPLCKLQSGASPPPNPHISPGKDAQESLDASSSLFAGLLEAYGAELEPQGGGQGGGGDGEEQLAFQLVDPRDLETEDEDEEVVFPGGVTQEELDLATYLAMKGE